jgi:hypothetical protein
MCIKVASQGLRARSARLDAKEHRAWLEEPRQGAIRVMQRCDLMASDLYQVMACAI